MTCVCVCVCVYQFDKCAAALSCQCTCPEFAALGDYALPCAMHHWYILLTGEHVTSVIDLCV